MLKSELDEDPKENTSLDPKKQEIAINAIYDIIERKKEFAAPFIDRVPEIIAKDYRQVVAAEMFFSLIQSRLANSYYRSINVSLSI